MNEQPTPNVGQRLRLLREGRNLSLRALAERCGLSVNAVSRIERGENSPTVTSLHQLATALNVPITDFFQPSSDRKTVFVKRDNRLQSQQSGMTIESLGIGLRHQQLEPFLITLEPGAGTDGDQITHAGQEFIHCLKGEITYEIEQERYQLAVGDSLLFAAGQPHRFYNAATTMGVILLIFQAPEGSQVARERHLDT